MGQEVMTQREAWQVYDRWLDDPRVTFLDEPAGLEGAFREFSRKRIPTPKEWADPYLLHSAETYWIHEELSHCVLPAGVVPKQLVKTTQGF